MILPLQSLSEFYIYRFHVESLIFWCSWPSVEAGAYIELFRNLGDTIRKGADLSVKWDEATTVIEMIELAHESAREGITVRVPC
jgi:hypothetical protein